MTLLLFFFVTKMYFEYLCVNTRLELKDINMANGTVKWFNNAKGYGFIRPEQGGEDIFAHYSTITMDGYRSLKAGQEVTFEMIEGDKGLHATQIKMAEPEE